MFQGLITLAIVSTFLILQIFAVTPLPLSLLLSIPPLLPTIIQLVTLLWKSLLKALLPLILSVKMYQPLSLYLQRIMLLRLFKLMTNSIHVLLYIRTHRKTPKLIPSFLEE